MQKKNTWKSEDLSLFSLQLSHLLQSGVPLVASLELLVDQKVISEKIGNRLISSLQQGRSFSTALRQEQFPDLFISFIRAAEEHGDFVYGLKQCEAYYDSRAKLIQDIIQACTYPLIVLFCVGLSLSFLIMVVLPRFAELYQTLGVKLPTITALMLSFANMIQNILFILVGIIFLFVIIGFFMRFGSNSIKPHFERLLFGLPIIKRFYQLRITHYVTIQLGSLLKSGVPLLPSLNLMEKLSPWVILSEAIRIIKDQVIQGKSLHESIKGVNQSLFLSSLSRMVAIGEKTGQLDQSLLSLAKSTEIYLRTQLKRWVRSLEPTLIFLLGVFIAVTVIAMFLPMLQMVQAI